MKIFYKEVEVKTERRNQFIRITEKIEKVVEESGIRKGVVLLSSPHNTATILIQEDDKSVHRDIIKILEKNVPLNEEYEHSYEGNENATAHIKCNLLGGSLIVPVQNGKMMLGTWQDIFFLELFEPRRRRVLVTVIGEEHE